MTQWFTDLDNVVADGLDFLDAIADTPEEAADLEARAELMQKVTAIVLPRSLRMRTQRRPARIGVPLRSA